jgi:hypothetical protein
MTLLGRSEVFLSAKEGRRVGDRGVVIVLQ